MSGFYNYDTRGASAASQIITLERMVQERDDEIERLTSLNGSLTDRWNAAVIRDARQSEGITADTALLRQALENLEGAAPRNGLWEPYAAVIAALRERLEKAT